MHKTRSRSSKEIRKGTTTRILSPVRFHSSMSPHRRLFIAPAFAIAHAPNSPMTLFGAWRDLVRDVVWRAKSPAAYSGETEKFTNFVSSILDIGEASDIIKHEESLLDTSFPRGEFRRSLCDSNFSAKKVTVTIKVSQPAANR